MPWPSWPRCPCGCGVEGLKLTAVLTRGPFAGQQHVKGCRCRSHIAKRNRKGGQRGQHDMHRDLGGIGFTPSNEESGRGYDVSVLATEGGTLTTDAAVQVVSVHPEAKTGQQVPASLVKFLTTDWYRRALGQSQRGLPFGSGARPAVWCQLPGGRKVLVVDFGGGRHGHHTEAG